ncbi:MAG TPA: EAL domain-containing protein [Telluria sp.]|nr:EAL domain-containing protein [Telluria sp.]
MDQPDETQPGRVGSDGASTGAPTSPPHDDPAEGGTLLLEKAWLNISDIVFRVRVEGGGVYRFVEANPAYYKSTRLSPQQAVGQPLTELVPDSTMATVLPHFEEAIRCRCTQRWEQVSEYPAGRRIGQASITPVFDEQGRCTDLIAIVHDITELKLREEQLQSANLELEQALAEQQRLAETIRSNEERLNFALEGTGEGVWDWRVDEKKIMYSSQWKRVLGLPDQFAGDELEDWLSRVVPEDLPALMERMEACLNSTDSVFSQECRMRHGSGDPIWVRLRGSVVTRTGGGTPQRMVGTIVDITDNVRLREQLEASYVLLAQLAQQVPGALFKLSRDPDGNYSCTYISAMARQLFELEPEDIMRDVTLLHERMVEGDSERLMRAREKSAASLHAWREEFRVQLPTKGLCWREVNATPTRARNGTVVWHGFINDISQRKGHELTINQFNEKLERRAHYDALTGLPNRALFRDRLEQGMRHARDTDSGIALLFLDLDRFKEVNDLLGHDAGDRLLIDAARRIERCVRAGDTVARLGGDEFTVVLTEPHELVHIERIAQDILDALAQPFSLGVEQVHVSCSIGIATYPDDGKTLDELMRNADHAMYRAKSAGRNQLTFFEVGMQAAAMHRLKLASDLRRALPEKQLALFFQPIVDLATGEVHKAEALLRWRRPQAGLVLPGAFVEIAEESGLIHDIGNWVFTTSAQYAKHWSAMLGYPFQISINKSPVQFQHHASRMDWVAYLRQLELPPGCISVEITEGLLLNLSEKVLAKLAQLHAGGVEVAIDDFGTGYSSMSYLKRLDIDYLKIDQSFVAEMLHDSTSQTITETIIVMAHKLGLKVIAEGVERREQRDWLAERGCDYAQGYLFGLPVEAAEFEKGLLAK